MEGSNTGRGKEHNELIEILFVKPRLHYCNLNCGGIVTPFRQVSF